MKNTQINNKKGQNLQNNNQQNIPQIPKEYIPFDTFTSQIAANEIIENILNKGADILYDNYLESKVPNHTKNFVFNSLNSLLGLTYKPIDYEKTEFPIIDEESLVKRDYDSKCSYALKVEKKMIIMPEPEDDLVSEYMTNNGGNSPNKRFMNQTNKSFRSQRSVRTQRSVSSVMYSQSQQQDLLKKNSKREKKALEQVQELNIMKLQDPALSESQVEYKNTEEKLRAHYMVQLNDRAQQEEKERLANQTAKQMEKANKKRLNDMKTKKYTYDFDGNLIFSKPGGGYPKGKQYAVGPAQTDAVNMGFKVSHGNHDISSHYRSMFEQGKKDGIQENQQKQQKRVRINSSDSVRSKQSQKNIMDKYQLPKPEPVILVAANSDTVKERLHQAQVQKLEKQKLKNLKDGVTPEIFDNGGQRQTSMIPLIKMNKGVTLTEIQRGVPITVKGPEVFDEANFEKNNNINEDGEPQSQNNNNKKRMKRSEYLQFIENHKFIPGEAFTKKHNQSNNRILEQDDDEYSSQYENDNQIVRHNRTDIIIAPVQSQENSYNNKNPLNINLKVDSVQQQQKYYNKSNNASINNTNNNNAEAILKQRLSQNYDSESEIDLEKLKKNPIKITDNYSDINEVILKNHQQTRNNLPNIKTQKLQPHSNYKDKMDNYFKDFVESPIRQRMLQQKENEKQKNQAIKQNNKNFKQDPTIQYSRKNDLNNNQKLPTLIKRPPSNDKKKLFDSIQKRPRNMTDQGRSSTKLSTDNLMSKNTITNINNNSQQKRNTRGNSLYQAGQDTQSKEQVLENQESKIKIQKKMLINLLVS